MDFAPLIAKLIAKSIALLCAFAVGGFEPVHEPFPAATDFVYDVYGNHWMLDKGGHLLVAPAQNPDKRELVQSGPWKFLRPDEYGYVWVADSKRIQRVDPRAPAQGWDDFTDLLAGGEITAMDNSPSGSVLISLSEGKIAELDRIDKRTIELAPAPRRITALRTDGQGRIWAKAEGVVYRKAALPEAWQKTWELAGRLPGGNHDLAGETIGTRFYIAGGQTAAWGYPAVAHVFDSLYEFDEPAREWRVAAKLQRPRFYNGTAALNGEIWVIAGCTRDAAGKAVFLDSVEICDPRTGSVKAGPVLPFALEMPLAVHIGERIYVAGNDRLLSIGAGETNWREEPGMPVADGLKAFAGTAWNDQFFVTIPKLGLASFDSRLNAWATVSTEWRPRSAQVAEFRNELWVMGGREIPDGKVTMIYNPVSRSWRRGPDLPRDLAWGAAATVNGRLLVAGGAAGRCYNNRTFILR